MITKQITPIVTTDKIEILKKFYTNHFDFEVSFEFENKHLSLISKGNKSNEISFMAPEPGMPSFDGNGLMFCLQVDDVDEEYVRIKKEGLGIALELKDNPWGDRSFVTMDPIGIAIYIYKIILPTEEFKKCFKK